MGSGTEVHAGQMRQVAAGGVAVQNLLEKQEGGDDRRERSSALSELGFVGQLLHQAFRHIGFEIALDPLQGLIDSEHQDLLSKMGRVVQPSSWPEVLVLTSRTELLARQSNAA
jgi:hypothetical protein